MFNSFSLGDGERAALQARIAQQQQIESEQESEQEEVSFEAQVATAQTEFSPELENVFQREQRVQTALAEHNARAEAHAALSAEETMRAAGEDHPAADSADDAAEDAAEDAAQTQQSNPTRGKKNARTE